MDQPYTLREALEELARQMDPAACLRRAAEALADNDIDEARAALDDYRAWRSRGGFEPADGDDLERQLRARLEQQGQDGRP
jgi:hypothetical protein